MERDSDVMELISNAGIETATRYTHDTIRRYAKRIYASAIRVEREAILPLREVLAAFTEANTATAQDEAWENLCNTLDDLLIIEKLKQAHRYMRHHTEPPEQALDLFARRSDINRDEQPFQLALEFMHNLRNRFLLLILNLASFVETLSDTFETPSDDREIHAYHIEKQLSRGRKAHGKAMLTLHRYFILGRVELVDRQVVSRLKKLFEPLIEAADIGDENKLQELWEAIDATKIPRAASVFKTQAERLLTLKGKIDSYYKYLCEAGESTDFLADQIALLSEKTDEAAESLILIANVIHRNTDLCPSPGEMKELTDAFKAWDKTADMSKSFKEWETLGENADVFVFSTK